MLAYQAAQFHRLLEYVWPRSAFFREFYSDHGIREADLGEVTPPDLPVLEKRLLMENFDRAVTDHAVRFEDVASCRENPEAGLKPALRPYVIITTSGTSGEPAILLLDERCWVTTQVAFTLRLIHRKGRRKWVHRRAFCGGSYHLAGGAQMTEARPPLSPSPLLLSPQEPLDRTVDQLNAHQPTLLTGFTSRIGALAREAIEGRLRIDPEVVGTSGENLSRGMEEDIEHAWPGRQVNAYSASESLCMAARRYQKPFTVYDDLNVIEVVDGTGKPVPPGETGEVVITNLHNRILPLIRYRMADLATQGEEPEEGPFSRMETLLGRDKDAIPVIRDDGSPGEITSVSFSGYVSTELKQFRVVLTAPDLIEVQYVAKSDIDGTMSEKLRKALAKSDAANRMRVEVRRMSELPADPSTGKVRFTEVLCDLKGHQTG